jgi:hypothetical protein
MIRAKCLATADPAQKHTSASMDHGDLSGLLRQQLEALEDSAYILMNEEKVEGFDQRSKRIAELKAMLGHRGCF